MVSQTVKLLVVSLVFHLLYSASIFDIYFTSPVVHPTRRYSANNVIEYLREQAGGAKVQHAPAIEQQRPADRLVLIVGDGLRADTLFKEHQAGMLPAWASIPLDPAEALAPRKNWSTAQRGKGVPDTPFFAAPHLREAAITRGTWGISHTRVPTESRPGHVALIAGMYEDVSAVTKGWKQNPIPFDSVFNQSSHTFSFGSPDILPMFARGALPGQVDMQMYDEEAEDFTSDASELDLWVLDRLRNLFTQARTNETLASQLREPGTVFFLHLLGLDTTGHTYRPRSAEYVGNLVVVDAIVAEVERLFSGFYKEDAERTAYVFTADHGMSHKGNHGDGEPDNTRTPIVAWGSGVPQPKAATSEQAWRELQKQNDVYYAGWGKVDHVWRHDIAQADIATLMSTLLGINVPANAEGRLPLAYIETSASYKAQASFANALEVLEMYKVKHEGRRRRMLRYVPFRGLSSASSLEPGVEHVGKIQDAYRRNDFVAAIEHSEELIDLALEGTRYLQTYDWMLLIGIVFVGYLGSMLNSAAFLIRRYVDKEDQAGGAKSERGSSYGQAIVIGAMAILFSKFAAEGAPATYYLYVTFAAFYWVSFSRQLWVFRLLAGQASRTDGTRTILQRIAGSWIATSVCVLAALELMVVGYLNRLAWSVGFIVIGFVWPAASISIDVKSRHELLLIAWTIMCGIGATFTVGSVDKDESVVHLVVSGIIFLTAGTIALARPDLFLGQTADASAAVNKAWRRMQRTLKVQLGVLIVSTVVAVSSSLSLQRKEGLPRLNQLVAWVVLGECLTVPFLYGFRHRQGETLSAACRVAIVIFGFAPLFVLLSLRDEAIFFACYCCILLLWAKLEGALYEERTYTANRTKYISSNGVKDEKSAEGTAPGKTTGAGRSLQREDIRVAIFFLFFLHVGFFGTGNIASISSFYLSPVYRLVPVFSPFLMAALLILKILVPFVILACVLQRLCVTLPQRDRIAGTKARSTGKELAGPPLLGQESVGGLGLPDAYSIVLLACLFTDVLAVNFLATVRTEGSWLEIGQSITHFVMSNMLQVFMLALAAVADLVVG